MKKLILLALILCSIQGFAKRYLVQTGAPGAATWRAAGDGEELVDLTANGQSFNTWYNATVISTDEVWIAAGNYVLSGVNTVSQSNHSVYGGFAGTEVQPSDRAKGNVAWAFTNETILDGNNATQVLLAGGPLSNVVFDGITITKSTASNAAAQFRSGVTLQNCKITNNTSTGNGGGINLYNGGSVTNSYIAANLASHGGGIYSNTANAETASITGCLIEDNRGSSTCGGIRVQGAGPGTTVVTNCIIRGNKGWDGTSAKPGGAIYTNSGNNSFINCLIVNNSGTNTVYFNGGNLFNTTIANNVGQVLIASASNSMSLTNCLVWGNKTDTSGATNTGITSNTGNLNVTIKNCGISPAPGAGWTQQANFTLEYGNESQQNDKGPGFVLPTTFWGAPGSPSQQTELENADWYIKNTSGAINKGTASVSYTNDLSGNPRPQNGTFDIGAYERMPLYYTSVKTGSWSGTGTWNSSTDNLNWTAAVDVPSVYDQSVVVQNDHEINVNVNGSSTTLIIQPKGKLTIDAGQTLNLSATLTLESNANGTATVVDANTDLNGLTVAGATSVQHYLPGGGRTWWYVSSPLTEASSTIFDGDKIGKHVEDYENDGDETTSAPYYTSPFSTPENLNPGRGYLVKRTAPATGTTYTFTGGSLNTGNITLTPTRTGTSQGARGFNLLGNPYPSYIDWDAIHAESTNMRNAIWFRTFDTTTGSMVFHTYGDGDAVPEITSPKIAPMQAFWVKVDKDNTPASVTFRNIHRSHFTTGANPLKVKTAGNRQRLRLVISNGSATDETLLVGKSYASNSLDNYDIEKMSDNNGEIPEIYSLIDHQELVINSMQALSDGLVVALGIRPGKPGNFSIETTQLENINGRVILVDQLTGTETELNPGSGYSFTADGTANNRFSLEFRAPAAITGFHNANSQLKVVASGNSIVIQGLSAGKVVRIFNTMGQELYSATVSADRTELQHSCSPGLYLVKVNNETTKVTVK